jgi:hypothetical protein
LALALAAALIASVVLVAPASATIVPGRGMAGVGLRMSETQARAKLGAPVQIRRTLGALGFLVTRLHYRLIDIELQRLGSKRVVIRILTTHPGERTASGVGVGSPLAAVQRLPRAHCWWEGGVHYCGIGSRAKPGSRFTMFWISARQRVALVSVSLVVNS